MVRMMCAGAAGLALALGVALPMPAAAQKGAPSGRQATSPAQVASCVRDYRRALLSEKAPALIADFARMGYQTKYLQLVNRHDIVPSAYRGVFGLTPEFETALEATARGNGVLFGEYWTSMNAFPVHTDLDSGDPEREARAIAALARCDDEFGFRTITRAVPPADFECAVRYVVAGQLFPQDRAGSMERANLSAAAHRQANPSETPAALNDRIKVEATARLKGFEALIAEGSKISEAWRDAADYRDTEQRRADLEQRQQDWQGRQRAAGEQVAAGIAACEAKYGRTPPPERPRAQGQ